MIAPVILSAVLPALRHVFDRAFPDPIERAKAESEATVAILDAEKSLREAAANVLMAEIRGESWLQRSWRPITMLTFLVCVVGYWFGFTPDTIPESAVMSMFDLLQIGIGGYIISRSAEKIIHDLPKKQNPLDAWRANRE